MDGVDIDEALVRSLLREQHPDLAELGLREVPGGWDNRMWRLGENLAVRLPLTPRAPSLLDKERRWLPVLAPSLPLPVPVPVRAGEPSTRFPKTWSVVRWVDETPADRSAISRPESASTLAGFLRALHGKAPGEAPVSPDRSAPLQTLQDADFEEWLAYVLPPGGVAAQARAELERVLAAPAWVAADVAQPLAVDDIAECPGDGPRRPR